MERILRDPMGRILNYIRISITDRCNFRCRYCMPEKGVPWIEHDLILSYEDILFLCYVLEKMGAKKLRFTGGEPLVRRGFLPFLAQVRHQFSSMELSLTTNGSLLTSAAPQILPLKLKSINVSLDTLSPEKFRYITSTGNLEDVLAGIHSVKGQTETEIKINTVLIKGFNDEEIPSLLTFARNEGVLLRLIEFMPLDSGVWSKDCFISADHIMASLPDAAFWEKEKGVVSPCSGPAVYFTHKGTGQRLGIIAAVSHHFCATCNRLRVTSVGKILSCLFCQDGIDIRQALRLRDEKMVVESFMLAVSKKPKQWLDVQSGHEHMSQIGG